VRTFLTSLLGSKPRIFMRVPRRTVLLPPELLPELELSGNPLAPAFTGIFFGILIAATGAVRGLLASGELEAVVCGFFMRRLPPLTAGTAPDAAAFRSSFPRRSFWNSSSVGKPASLRRRRPVKRLMASKEGLRPEPSNTWRMHEKTRPL